MANGWYSRKYIADIAMGLGFDIDDEELALYHERINGQIELLSKFFEEEGMIEPALPVAPGRSFKTVSPTEPDPFHAWVWRGEVRSDGDGVLSGKTIGLKDHIPLAGAPTTYGSAMLAENIASFDAPIVTRLLSAGGVIVGKHNMDNFSMPGPSMAGLGDRSRPNNPSAPAHVTGGSSSGGAVAVVAGECDIAIGGDQGGSIRIPAAFCGVVGLKPTFGAVSHFGVIGSDPTVDTLGPMTLCVELNAQTFDVLAGTDGFDHRQYNVPETFDVTSTLGDGVKGLRIGLLHEGMPEGTDPELVNATLAVAQLLENAGATVARVSIPEHLKTGAMGLAIGTEGSRLLADGGYVSAFSMFPVATSVGLAVKRARTANPEMVPAGYKLRYMSAEVARRRWHGSMYAAAMNARLRLREKYNRAFESFDVLLMPTMLSLPPRYVEPNGPIEALDFTLLKVGTSLTGTAQTATLNTMPFNMSGHPALAVPVGRASDLPLSVQLVGPYFGEDILYRCAIVIEEKFVGEAAKG